MHETDFSHEHIETAGERAAVARAIWKEDNIAFTTVGIDIGSSTSHLLFAKVLLQRQSRGLSSRFVVAAREIVWRSPILLTPFLPDGMIDTAELHEFIRACYRNAGFARADIGGGAVILTGEAIKQKNARAIDELFAAESGKFVCATAGHRLESRLAAHGSGAVGLSKARGICLLHVDIGGGTTKLALIDRGAVVGLSAFAVGGRLIAAGASLSDHAGAARVAPQREGRRQPAVSKSVKEGGDQIEYEDQDPRIHRIWLDEMGKNGAPPKMEKFIPTPADMKPVVSS
jgi:ethanolamine utilization protein EutA